MAAGEDQPQPLVRELVGDIRLPAPTAQRLERLELAALGRERLLPADAVDRLVARDAGDPGAGVVGNAVARPALEGDYERLLDRLLGEVEVAEDPDERRDRPSRLEPEQAVDDCSWTGGARRRAARRCRYDAAFSRSSGWT